MSYEKLYTQQEI